MPIYAFIIAGIMSFYTADEGAITASGQRFDPGAHTCAMRYEPFGERVEIINDDNGSMSWCVVNDRGPWPPGRVIDVTPKVAGELGIISAGLADVRVYKVTGFLPVCKLTPRSETCKTPPRECVLDLPKPALLSCK